MKLIGGGIPVCPIDCDRKRDYIYCFHEHGKSRFEMCEIYKSKLVIEIPDQVAQELIRQKKLFPSEAELRTMSRRDGLEHDLTDQVLGENRGLEE